MKRFSVCVSRIEQVTVEIDETIVTPEKMAEYRDPVDPILYYQDLALYLAIETTKEPSGRFIDGVGAVTRNGGFARGPSDWDRDSGMPVPAADRDQEEPGLNVVGDFRPLIGTIIQEM